MSAPRVELLLFTYVPTENAADFVTRLSEFGIKGFAQSKPDAPSKPIDLWDYPYYEETVIDQSCVTSILELAGRITPVTHAVLDEFRLIYLDSPPAHYSFSFVLVFRFTAKMRVVKSKDELREDLDQAATQIKKFVEWVFPNAEYRPTYWFISDLPDYLQGLSGTINTVKAPSSGELRIERAFPKFSYIIYASNNSHPNGSTILTNWLNVTDLGLLSAVAHLTERGYREKLHKLISELPDHSDHFITPSEDTNQTSSSLKVDASPDQSVDKLSLSQLSADMNKLLLMQQQLESPMKNYYHLRRQLIRTKGLVMRIREKCGGAKDKNLFDIVCDDALTVVEDEISSSLIEIENRFRGLSDTLNIRFNQLNSQRTKKLQTIGLYLQATAVTGIAYKIFADLLPTIPSLKSHLSSQIVLAMLVAVLFGLFTFFLLKKRLE